MDGRKGGQKIRRHTKNKNQGKNVFRAGEKSETQKNKFLVWAPKILNTGRGRRGNELMVARGVRKKRGHKRTIIL